MWVWVVALVATVAGLALAGRAVLRAEAALATVHDGLRGVPEVAAAREGLDAATRRTAGSRVRLHTEARSQA